MKSDDGMLEKTLSSLIAKENLDDSCMGFLRLIASSLTGTDEFIEFLFDQLNSMRQKADNPVTVSMRILEQISERDEVTGCIFMAH